MKKLFATLIIFAALVPALAAQAANFTGKWEGTFIPQRPDGTEGSPRNVVLNLTQSGKQLTGTAGPPDQQWKIEKAVLADGQASFEVQQPNGAVLKFKVNIAKDGLQGDMSLERDGELRGRAKVTAARAK